jgi:hypothetical protein
MTTNVHDHSMSKRGMWTDVAPIDAAETVVMLLTAGVVLVLLSVVSMFAAQGAWSYASWELTTPLFMLGGVCLVGAGVVHALRGTSE